MKIGIIGFPQSRKTTLLADISGFTAFVTATELEHGPPIIAALLEEVIRHSPLLLAVASSPARVAASGSGPPSSTSWRAATPGSGNPKKGDGNILYTLAMPSTRRTSSLESSNS